MAEVKDTPGDAIDAFAGTETDDQAEFALRDFAAKDIAIAAANRSVGGAGSPQIFPSECFIHALSTPFAESNWDGRNKDQNQPIRFSDNTNGSWIEYRLLLKAGVWALDITTFKFDGGGIIRFSLNDGNGLVVVDQAPYNASGATVDTYNATVDTVISATIATDLEIPEDGAYTLRLTINGKNASSTGFQGTFYYLSMTRLDA